MATLTHRRRGTLGDSRGLLLANPTRAMFCPVPVVNEETFREPLCNTPKLRMLFYLHQSGSMTQKIMVFLVLFAIIHAVYFVFNRFHILDFSSNSFSSRRYCSPSSRSWSHSASSSVLGRSMLRRCSKDLKIAIRLLPLMLISASSPSRCSCPPLRG